MMKTKTAKCNPLCNKTICGLAIATSIDALAVGISLALISTGIMIQALTIGLVTFAFSAFGGNFGGRFGRNINLRLNDPGIILFLSVLNKILSEHLFSKILKTVSRKGPIILSDKTKPGTRKLNRP